MNGRGAQEEKGRGLERKDSGNQEIILGRKEPEIEYLDIYTKAQVTCMGIKVRRYLAIYFIFESPV